MISLTTSAELVSHDNILTQILLRLPIRSIVRFKCVSKHWQYLLSSSRFALLHRNLNHKLNSPSGLMLRRNNARTKPEYAFVLFDHVNPVKTPFKSIDHIVFDKKQLFSYDIMQSSNGLLLIRTMIMDYHVYNPTINQCSNIPKYDNKDDGFESVPRGMTLVFDPLISPHYKLVCIRMFLGSCYGRIEVYSSENRNWVSFAKQVFMPDSKVELRSGIYWDDRIHWARNVAVYYFNINENRGDHILLPYDVRGHILSSGWRDCYPSLVESNDSLLLYEDFYSSGKVNIYELKKDYSGWSKKYYVRIEHIHSDLINRNLFFRNYIVHYFFPGVLREEDAYLVIETPRSIIRYNLLSKSCQKLCVFDSSIPHRKLGVFLFNESLSHV
ncbi:F-box protein At5g07610-like [Rutidosis leptorrhynchoides]|uniref:F-box protein At5g07610-like n=1 Tax=Rutidosis leptorrhynchoides TaxID=125765 RepID=UPI003A99080B